MAVKFKRAPGASLSATLLERFTNSVLGKRRSFAAAFLPQQLFIEELLLELCRRRSVSPSYFEDAKLTFRQLLAVAAALSVTDDERWLYDACAKVNAIRNALVHSLDTEFDSTRLPRLIDNLLATLMPRANSSDWAVALQKGGLEDRVEAALNFVISSILTKIGPDAFETHADRLIKSWTRQNGTLSPPTLNIPDLTGVYRSISETSWTTTLSLAEDGQGILEHVWWTYEEAPEGTMSRKDVSESRNVSWTNNGALIEVMYGSVVDTLCFDRETPLSEIGMANHHPGLSQRQPWPEGSLIRGATLWKHPHDFWPNVAI